MCPEFPGIIDYSLWEIGRKWCRSDNPDCRVCIVSTECPYYNNSLIAKKHGSKVFSKIGNLK